MVSKKIVVDSALGIHLRPAAAMSDIAIKYDARVGFNCGNGKSANAKSVISILAAGVKCGEQIELFVDGEAEEEILCEVEEAFKASLKED